MFKTDYLTASNSFLSGVGRVLDLGSTRNKRVYNFSRSSEEADFKALMNDWNMVGQDMRKVVTHATSEKQPSR